MNDEQLHEIGIIAAQCTERMICAWSANGLIAHWESDDIGSAIRNAYDVAVSGQKINKDTDKQLDGAL